MNCNYFYDLTASFLLLLFLYNNYIKMSGILMLMFELYPDECK